MYKLSIITINLNNCFNLKKTIESVFSQTFTDYEYIIIDGGSTDGSKELIEKYQNRFVYWISEKDNGIYNAMNKGIIKANGEYLLFLNSGDCLYNDLVLMQFFNKKSISDIIYGNVFWNPEISHHNGIFPDKLTFEYFKINSLPHQASFINKKLFEVVGLYDENYKIISDWLFFLLAIYRFNCSYEHRNQIITTCDTQGLSFEEDSWSKIVKEREEAVSKYFKAIAAEFERLYFLRNQLNLVKRSKGYRMQMMMHNFLQKYFNSGN
jgi:glycosyltransferase involved in cell wall biosynthesis